MDRRLGRPLPHQLPNPTRANPLAINLSSLDHIRYYSQFPGAIPYQRVCSHALLTRPPLGPKSPLDLHVLGLPPAFILSQDQTLKLKAHLYAILDVRNRCTSLPLSGKPSYRYCAFQSLSGPETNKNREADILIIGTPTRAETPRGHDTQTV
jgi:hypothetical protein